MAPATSGGHYQEVAWRRGAREPGEDDQYPGLSIEFDDDAEEDPGSEAEALAAAGAGAAGVASSADLVSTRPASRWSRIPVRYRVTATVTALVLVVGAVTADRLDRSAQQRARERFSLAVVDDRYQPTLFEVGLNMALTLVDNGPAPVTVEFLQVRQPGLSLAFYPVEVPLAVGKPTAFTLVGVFGCDRTTAPGASTVEVTVTGRSGTTSSVVLGLKAGSVPPKGWQDQRSVFCAEANTSGP
jgi:hypothetical protein